MRESVEIFLEKIGGLENARLAIQMLSRLERAATPKPSPGGRGSRAERAG